MGRSDHWLRPFGTSAVRKSPQIATFFCSSTLDVFQPLVKIKIVEDQKHSSLWRLSRAKRDIRPYNIRVSRDHGGGLWSLEDDAGQLYLAVLSYENSRIRRELAEKRRGRS